jgi:hypothetical protein
MPKILVDRFRAGLSIHVAGLAMGLAKSVAHPLRGFAVRPRTAKIRVGLGNSKPVKPAAHEQSRAGRGSFDQPKFSRLQRMAEMTGRSAAYDQAPKARFGPKAFV